MVKALAGKVGRVRRSGLSRNVTHPLHKPAHRPLQFVSSSPRGGSGGREGPASSLGASHGSAHAPAPPPPPLNDPPPSLAGEAPPPQGEEGAGGHTLGGGGPKDDACWPGYTRIEAEADMGGDDGERGEVDGGRREETPPWTHDAGDQEGRMRKRKHRQTVPERDSGTPCSCKRRILGELQLQGGSDTPRGGQASVSSSQAPGSSSASWQYHLGYQKRDDDIARCPLRPSPCPSFTQPIHDLKSLALSHRRFLSPLCAVLSRVACAASPAFTPAASCPGEV